MKGKVQVEAFWREHVESWRAGGGSQRAYSAQHGLAPSSFSYWCRRWSKAVASSAPAQGQPLSLVPTRVLAEAPAPEPRLCLRSPAGWQLEFSALPSAAWLASLLGRAA
jgi:hypothetical protein